MAISLTATSHAASAYGSAVSITHGASLQAGDVAIAFLEIDAGKTFADNNGAKPFTQSYSATVEAEDARSDIWYRVCDGGEASEFAWTASGNDDWSATVRVFRGVDSSVWDVAPSTANDGQGNSSTATAPTINILTTGACALLMVGLDASDNSATDVTNSFTDLIRYGQTTSRNHATAYRMGCSTGALGDTAVTLGFGDGWLAVQCALKPAASTTVTHNLAMMGVG